MTKGVEGGDDKITLAPGKRVWFYADQVAVCDVTFPAGSWDVAYWVKTLSTGEANTRLTTRLCYVSSDGTETRVKGGFNSISYSASLQENVEPLVPDDSFTVPQGGRLAIEVLWSSSAAGNLEIHCTPSGNPVSKTTSPSSDPGYPVPELSTLILFSVGLLVLVGYVGLRRRNNK